MARLRFTILGCGSSGGVPRLGGLWGECDPANPKNRRTRCSMMVERTEPDGTTRVLIDTSPDMREQLLTAGVGELDAVVFNTRRRMPVWADGATQDALISRFGYAFVQPAGSSYPPICDMHTIDGPFTIEGAGGGVTLIPFRVEHGAIDALGFRIGDLAYLPDVSDMDAAAWATVEGLDCWVIDALRRKPHPTHIHLDRALDWIARARPRRAVLTNMHIDLDHAAVTAETPDHVEAAFDGMTIDYEV